MLGKRIKIFSMFGFDVRIDWSWTIIALFLTWSLSTGLFPYQYSDLGARTYWLMGFFAAMGLFLSVIIHEFAHSLVARRVGLPIQGITLFLFGGVSEMGEEPPTPKAEFLMAIVGPLASAILAVLLFVAYRIGSAVGFSTPVVAVTQYLAVINGLLALFNLLPAFPLDGGRVLRSILWQLKSDLRWATRVSSYVGIFFAFFLIAYGFLRIAVGNLFGGMWMTLIGIFLHQAAHNSYRRLLVEKALEGESVERFMKSDPVVVSPSLSLERLVEDYIYQYQYKVFPVVESERLIGCVPVSRIKTVPREEWAHKTVGDLARPCSSENTVEPGMEAARLLSRMSETNNSRFMVVKDGRLLGMISVKDMLGFLSMKMSMEE